MEMAQISRVGAGVTLMPHAEVVLAEASRFAKMLGASLTLIHTGTSRKASESYIRDIASTSNVHYEETIVWNQTDPAEVLLAAVQQYEIELLVCGAFEGPSLNRRRFLSPVARKLMEDVPCSLLLLAHPSSPERSSFRRIVAITDFSEASKLACSWALWLAEQDRSESIHIIAIHSVFMDALVSKVNRNEKVVRTRIEEEELLEQFVFQLPSGNIHIERRVIEATTGFAACDFAEANESDLLVLPGRAGRERVPRMTDWALQVVPCSLWLVNDGQFNHGH